MHDKIKIPIAERKTENCAPYSFGELTFHPLALQTCSFAPEKGRARPKHLGMASAQAEEARDIHERECWLVEVRNILGTEYRGVDTGAAAAAAWGAAEIRCMRSLVQGLQRVRRGRGSWHS